MQRPCGVHMSHRGSTCCYNKGTKKSIFTGGHDTIANLHKQKINDIKCFMLQGKGTRFEIRSKEDAEKKYEDEE